MAAANSAEGKRPSQERNTKYSTASENGIVRAEASGTLRALYSCNIVVGKVGATNERNATDKYESVTHQHDKCSTLGDRGNRVMELR